MPKPAGKRGPLGIPKWGWIALLIGGALLFWYMRRKASASSTASSTTPPQGSDAQGVDPNQLASDIAAQLAAALGGTPASNDPTAGTADLSGFLAQLAAQEQSFLTQFGDNFAGMTGAGMLPTGQPQYPPNYPPQYPSPSGQPTQSANAFYPFGSGAASGGGSPLYAFSSGVGFAESPTAGSYFSPYTPASQGYEALGIHASDPVTLAPTSSITGSYSPTPHPLAGMAIPQ